MLDAFWIFRVESEYQTAGHEKLVMNTWLWADLAEMILAATLIGVYYFYQVLPLILLAIFIAFWLFTRILSSLRYKKVYFV